MAQLNYDAVISVLKNYKGIGDSEAKLFSRLIQRQRFTIDDVKKILKDIKEKKANSRAYQLIDSLKKNELIDEIKKSNPKTYRPIHPRVLFNELKKEQEQFEDAFGVIEQAYETCGEAREESSNGTETYQNESMILSKIQELISSGYCVKKVVCNNWYMSSLLSNVSNKDYSKEKKDGTTNCVIFEKKNLRAIFLVIDITDLSGVSRKEGIFIPDSNFADCFCEKRC